MRGFDQETLVKATAVKLVIFDVDGVLTDGTLSYTAEGETVKNFNVKDGLGIRLLMVHGIEVGIISARSSEPLARRVRDLGIAHFYCGQKDKLAAFDSLRQALGLRSCFKNYCAWHSGVARRLKILMYWHVHSGFSPPCALLCRRS